MTFKDLFQLKAFHDFMINRHQDQHEAKGEQERYQPEAMPVTSLKIFGRMGAGAGAVQIIHSGYLWETLEHPGIEHSMHQDRLMCPGPST